MGLFDFIKDIGEKLFKSDNDAADKIKQRIEASNPGIDLLNVSYDNGKVILSGKASSQEAYEKAVLIAGNIAGVTEVSANGLNAPEPSVKVEYYIIQKGDSLSKIAKQYYGNPMDYPKIFEANREVIKDANLIYPGQKIRIPLN